MVRATQDGYCLLYGLASCLYEWDCPLPWLVIVLVFRPEATPPASFEGLEISTLVMVVNLRAGRDLPW